MSLAEFRKQRESTYMQWLASGRNRAAAERYRACCRALGTTPPTPGEIERMVILGPPAGFIVPKSTVPISSLVG